MQTILITGANGFIGKYIKERGNFKNYNIIYGTTSHTNNQELTIFSTSYSNINRVLENQKIDIIIHCAAVIPTSFDDSDEKIFFDNTLMMTNLYKFSLMQNLKKFIYISSFGSMEEPNKYDIKDYYTLSKITGEHICSMMQSKGTQTASLRISSPFGEFYNKTNVLSLFIDLALQNKVINVYGTGNKEQNFIYVGNILEFIYSSLENDISGVYDVVAGKNLTMKQLASMIVQLCNSKSKIECGNYEDPMENYKLPVYDSSRNIELQYQEKYQFKDALLKYIEYRKGLFRL